MGKKTRNKITLSNFNRTFNIVLMADFILIVIINAVFLPLYFYFDIKMYIVIDLALTIGLLAFLIISMSISHIRLKKMTFDVIYKKSIENFEAIANQKRSLSYYDEGSEIVDLKELDKSLERVNKLAKNSILYPSSFSYTKLGLNPINEDLCLYDYISFEENYKNILLTVNVYRMAFISYTYNIKNKELSDEEKENFCKGIIKVLTYPKIAIIDNSSKNEFIIVVPGFDSIDRLKEEVQLSLDNISIIRYSSDGYNLVVPRASMVIYPYSEADEILFDLAYANRQNQQLFVYYPNNVKKSNENLLAHTFNVNFVGNLREKLSRINPQADDVKKVNKDIYEILSEFRRYFGYEFTEIVTYNDDEDRFYNFFEQFKGKDENSFDLNAEFVPILERHADSDCSYFFSSREHLSPELGKIFDIQGVQSGYYYVVKENDKVIGLILFLHKSGSTLDGFLKESIYSFSQSLKEVLMSLRNRYKIEERNERIDNLLKISNLKSFSVNKETFEVTYYSNILKGMVPNIEIGCKCYQAMYGKNKPCPNCPILKKKKIFEVIKGERYEASLVLSNPKKKDATVLLTPLEKDQLIVKERYDSDLLIGTFYAYIEFMQAAFTTFGRGYTVVVNIDNHRELHENMLSEDWNAYLRSFFSKVLTEIPDVKDLYFLPNHSFAMVFPDGHRKSTIEYIEHINDITELKLTNEQKDNKLHLSYFISSYPNGYQNCNEYVRYVLNVSQTPDQYLNKEMLFMPETKYIRSASHKEFVTDILNNSLTSNTFAIKLQPALNKADKHINGVEMLLRVSDNFLGNEMNTVEIINAASERNKISLITNILINKIDTLYEEYSNKLFKRYGVEHLSLNTDYSFFKDEKFIDKVLTLEQKHKLPKNFLVFEIQEKELANHYDEFAGITKAILKNEISMTCDNYTGEYLSVKKIKDLGFNGVKIDRRLILEIDKKPEAIDGVKEMIGQSRKLALTTSLVGIETREQYQLIREIDHNFLLQGYYFYKPLDVEELLNALVTTNI